MIISRAEIRSVISAYKTAKRKSLVSPSTADTADSFDPSLAAASIAGVIAQAQADAFYRPERVADLQRQIADGRYHVPTDEIVEKLLGRLIVEAVAG